MLINEIWDKGGDIYITQFHLNIHSPNIFSVPTMNLYYVRYWEYKSKQDIYDFGPHKPQILMNEEIIKIDV